MLNQFGTYLSENENVDENVIADLFDKLSAYARQHFTDEEALMKETGIDNRFFLAHHGEHQRFLKEIFDIYSRVGSSGTAESLFKFLTYWLAYHILGEDQSMAKQIRLINEGV